MEQEKQTEKIMWDEWSTDGDELFIYYRGKIVDVHNLHEIIDHHLEKHPWMEKV